MLLQVGNVKPETYLMCKIFYKFLLQIAKVAQKKIEKTSKNLPLVILQVMDTKHAHIHVELRSNFSGFWYLKMNIFGQNYSDIGVKLNLPFN